MEKNILIIIGSTLFIAVILFAVIFNQWFLKSPQQKEIDELNASSDNCLNLLPNNPGDAYDCYSNIAKEYKNNDICLVFPPHIEGGGLWNNSCNTACSFELAAATKNTSICDSVKYIDEVNKCYCYHKAGVAFEDLPRVYYQGEEKTCLEAYGEDFLQGEGYGFLSLCYKSIAVWFRDLKTCDKIQSGQEDLEGCYAKVAVAKDDVSICDMIKGDKDWCYWQVGGKKGDLKICSLIEAIDIRNYCYKDVAATKKDASVCSLINTNTNRDYCYWGVAVAKGDPSICDMIKILSSNEKESCRRGYLPGE